MGATLSAVTTTGDTEMMALLRSWCDEAVEAGDALPLAFAFATVDRTGRPTTRMMSVKDVRPEGLVVFMNAATRKGRDVSQRPDVAGTFWWPKLGRQVNVTGTLVELDDDDADAIWEGRDRVSQVADSIGQQGKPLVDSLEHLRVAAAAKAAAEDPVVRPSSARAYLLRPMTVELWTRGERRIHERLLYVRRDDGWRVVQLQP